jgi:hypothetical protein
MVGYQRRLQIATYLSMAIVVSKMLSEFPSEGKMYICKRHPIMEMVFLLMRLESILEIIAVVYQISRNEKMLIKLCMGLWRLVSILTAKHTRRFTILMNMQIKNKGMKRLPSSNWGNPEKETYWCSLITSQHTLSNLYCYGRKIQLAS